MKKYLLAFLFILPSTSFSADLGSFKSDTGTELLANGNRGTLMHAINGAGIDAHEILIGLQYKF